MTHGKITTHSRCMMELTCSLEHCVIVETRSNPFSPKPWPIENVGGFPGIERDNSATSKPLRIDNGKPICRSLHLYWLSLVVISFKTWKSLQVNIEQSIYLCIDIVFCDDSSSLMLSRELRKLQWLDGMSGTLCKALRALFVDKGYINALFIYLFII